jgi:hypothetical protein
MADFTRRENEPSKWTVYFLYKTNIALKKRVQTHKNRHTVLYNKKGKTYKKRKKKKNDVTFLRILEGFIHDMAILVILPQKEGTRSAYRLYIYMPLVAHSAISLHLFFFLFARLCCVRFFADPPLAFSKQQLPSIILQISLIIL